MTHTEEINVIDGCRVLDRSRAYVIPSGAEATLQFVFRNKQGQPVRLNDDDEIYALIREPLSKGSSTHDASSISDPIFRITCDLIQEGTDPDFYYEKVEAELPADLIDSPGIYQVEWAVFAAGSERPNRIASSLLSVEASNWTKLETELGRHGGPPTITELRYAIQDNGRVDNVLLQRCEFSADQIMMALIRPVRMWNEQLPLLASHNFNTRNYPYREQWMRATAALLQQAAANNYLRNKTEEDGDLLRNRDVSYDKMARMDLDRYMGFVRQQKHAISLNQGFGEITSDYSLINSSWHY